MSLQLGRAIVDGSTRVFTRAGAMLLVGLVALQFLVQSSVNTVVAGLFPPEAAGELNQMLGLTLPVPGSVAGGLFVLALVLTSAYYVVLARAFVRPTSEQSALPADLYTRRIGRATLSQVVGGIFVGFAVGVGLAFLILPGLFLSVCFLFFGFAVAVEDRGILDALRRSWGLSRGNRLKLAVLVVLTGVVGAVIGVTGSVFDMANSPVVGEALVNVLGSVLYVFLYGVIAAAYLQVREDSEGFDGPETTGTPDDAFVAE
ncbi:hypothetical protein NGM10_07655 [Halorussus salilacus]|uniref:DUF7847 domain-containing protein n=1 Tax=Halorussus salilacus TaxID=2953750 RepID=UPI00209F5249|nr:hypothetical protein [Halorussus salilacus]USZ69595.1 hypothetical protein NGM10_07655 [Halorussus salilacus]